MDRTVAKALDSGSRTAIRRIVAAGAAAYDRASMLPRLIAAGPDDLAPDSAATARRICRRLARALRQERNRGRSGHWTYDLSRHLGLLQAYRAERAALARLIRREAADGSSAPEPGAAAAADDAPGRERAGEPRKDARP